MNEISTNERKREWFRGVHARSGPANRRAARTDQSRSTAPGLSLVFQLSHYVLVHLRFAVVGCRERAQPGHREWMAKHHSHVHPSRLFGPSSLLLFQLLDTLRE